MSRDPLWVPEETLAGFLHEYDALVAVEAVSTTAQAMRRVELSHILRRADTSTRPDDGVVEPGMLVEVLIDGATEPAHFLLADYHAVSVETLVSPYTALGAAVNGRRVGDSLTYLGPTGREITAEIVSVRPYAQGHTDLSLSNGWET